MANNILHFIKCFIGIIVNHLLFWFISFFWRLFHKIGLKLQIWIRLLNYLLLSLTHDVLFKRPFHDERLGAAKLILLSLPRIFLLILQLLFLDLVASGWRNFIVVFNFVISQKFFLGTASLSTPLFNHLFVLTTIHLNIIGWTLVSTRRWIIYESLDLSPPLPVEFGIPIRIIEMRRSIGSRSISAILRRTILHL